MPVHEHRSAAALICDRRGQVVDQQVEIVYQAPLQTGGLAVPAMIDSDDTKAMIGEVLRNMFVSPGMFGVPVNQQDIRHRFAIGFPGVSVERDRPVLRRLTIACTGS